MPTPHPIAVNLAYYSEPFSIAPCGTAEFTWESTWRPVSGIGVSGGSEPPVFVYSRGPGADQGPAQIVDIVTGNRYIEYPRSEAPSLPPCTIPSSFVGTSGGLPGACEPRRRPDARIPTLHWRTGTTDSDRCYHVPGDLRGSMVVLGRPVRVAEIDAEGRSVGRFLGIWDRRDAETALAAILDRDPRNEQLISVPVCIGPRRL
jgi:hypothetical protein